MTEVPFGRGDVDPSVLGVVNFSGYTTLCAAPDGTIDGLPRRGLYDYDTRILSAYRLRLDGRDLPFVSAVSPDASRRIITLRCEIEGGTPDGPRLPRDGLEVTIRRRVGRGMLDEIEVANHSMVASRCELTLEADADFGEILARVGDDRKVGRISRRWNEDGQTLQLDFEAHENGHDLRRGTRLRVLPGSQQAHGSARLLQFRFDLPAKGSGSVRLAVESLVDGAWRSPLDLAPDVLAESERDRVAAAWDAGRTHMEGAAHAQDAFEQSAEDLHALRLWELDELARPAAAADGAEEADGADSAGASPNSPAWIASAGAPLYSGIFGRDILTTGWQSAILGPEIMIGALEVAARTQATRDSAFHDEEPGKMLHEARRGPLSDLEILPQRAYYGAQTTVSMFLIALSELWHWTGDDKMLRHHLDAALRTFEWADRYGDLDGDGFLEYRRRAPYGPKNQGWKDSDDAIRYPDGGQVPNPIATVEEQAFHFLALQRMAEILVALEEDTRADEFLGRAAELRERWDAAFWLPEQGFYAMGLDPDKKPIASIGSNPGHALGTGIVPVERARAVADRLLAPDMFSGWGVRTLSSEHPSYNPFGYHLGSVWPVENATFALGFKRYGLDDHVERLVDAQFRAASHFRHHRLPEVISGHGSDERPAPSIYPASNAPQAWSASAATQLIQIALGLYPFAPLGLLAIVRPRLPAWLPVVTLRNLRVGDARLTLRFERSADGSVHHDVVERTGRIVVLPAPPPNSSEPEGIAESVKRWAIDHAPGRRLRALRIGLGAP